MEDSNLQTILIAHGAKEAVAREISDSISGTDLISLVDSLSEIDDKDIQGTIDVLKEYGSYVSESDFEEDNTLDIEEDNMRTPFGQRVTGLSEDPILGRLRTLAGINEDSSEEILPVDDEVEVTDDLGDEDGIENDNYGSEENLPADDYSDVADVSDAMSTIQDAINNISTSFPDLRVSEYKQVVDQIKDLSDSLRDQGRQYLGERMNRRFRRR